MARGCSFLFGNTHVRRWKISKIHKNQNQNRKMSGIKILNKKEKKKMTVAKKRRKRLFDVALPLNYPRKASRDRSHAKFCDVNERLVGAPSREPLLL